TPSDFFDPLFEAIQKDLFTIGGHLATPDPDKGRAAPEKAALKNQPGGEFGRVMGGAGPRAPPPQAVLLPGRPPEAAGPPPRPPRMPPGRAQYRGARGGGTGAGSVSRLPEPAVGSAVRAGAAGQSSGRRRRRDLVAPVDRPNLDRACRRAVPGGDRPGGARAL